MKILAQNGSKKGKLADFPFLTKYNYGFFFYAKRSHVHMDLQVGLKNISKLSITQVGMNIQETHHQMKILADLTFRPARVAKGSLLLRERQVDLVQHLPDLAAVGAIRYTDE
jgi:hypothetical protein